jgi:hypothetical protein
MKTLIIVCVAIVAVFSVAFASSNSLSTSEMNATWGGGNCKVCPGTPNSTCTVSPCSFRDGACSGFSGGSYKVCAAGAPTQNCTNGTVTCGTSDSCANGEGSCSSSTYDCSCHSVAAYYFGC